MTIDQGGPEGETMHCVARMACAGLIASLGAMVALAVGAVPAAAEHEIDALYKTQAAGEQDCTDQGDNLPGDQACMADNSLHGIYANASIEATGRANIMTAIGRYDDTTLVAQYDNTPVFTGSGETDVVIRNNRTGMGDRSIVGITWCDDAVNDTRCDQHYITFYYPNPNLDNVMHEVGHSVGLTHGFNANPWIFNDDYRLWCMKNPPLGSVNLGPLNTHNIANNY